MTVACMVLYKDERVHLERIAEKILEAFDEAIFVTNLEGSSDGSEDFLASLGIEPLRMRWVESFAAARQVGLDASTSDHTLWMDCDDDLVTDLPSMSAAGDALRAYLSEHPQPYHWHRVYHADRRTFWVRENLFRRDSGVTVRYPTHEVYTIRGEAGTVPPGILDRVNAPLKADYKGKHWRYFDMLHTYLRDDDPGDCRCRYYLAAEFVGPPRAKNALYLDFLEAVDGRPTYRNFPEEWCALFGLFQGRRALPTETLLGWSQWLLLKYPFEFLAHVLDAMIRSELAPSAREARRLHGVVTRRAEYAQAGSGWFRGWYFDRAFNACGYYLHRAAVAEQDPGLGRLAVRVLEGADTPACLDEVRPLVRGNLAMARRWVDAFGAPPEAASALPQDKAMDV